MEKYMRVIVGCEFSQIVTMAFRNKGHEAFSCDIIPCEGGHPEWHYQTDILLLLKKEKFDLGIFHPPCTYLSYSGTSAWNEPGRIKKRLDALDFFRRLWEADIEKICIENPKGCASPVIAKYSQIIQPYYFGDDDMKTTWLWLKGLPLLKHIKEPDLFEKITHVKKPAALYISPKGKKEYFMTSANHKGNIGKSRARTFPGIARAMADTWE